MILLKVEEDWEGIRFIVVLKGHTCTDDMHFIPLEMPDWEDSSFPQGKKEKDAY